jgi:hypothetical protein
MSPKKKLLDQSGVGLLYAIMVAGFVAAFSYAVFDYWLYHGKRLNRYVDRTKYVDLAPARAQYYNDPAVLLDASTLVDSGNY